MAYIEPKIDWTDKEAPVGSDFNRIEGNAKANHDAVIVEAGIRENDIQNEKTARENDIQNEKTARINADTALQNTLSIEQTNRESGDIALTNALNLLRPESSKIGAQAGSGSFVLPTGGTYFYFGFYYNPVPSFPDFNPLCGVAPGGTTIYNNSYEACVIYWKIS